MNFLDKKIKLSDNSVVQEMGEGIVILNLNTERFYELNEVGSRFWELLSDNEDYKFALSKLQEEYEVDAERLQNDIIQLIKELEDAELIEII